MPLHEKNDVREKLVDDIYASSALSCCMPKYRIPEEEHESRTIFQVVQGRAAAGRELSPEPGPPFARPGWSRKSIN